VEIWNLVFQVYNKLPSSELEPLPKPGIDTGMGFERVVAVLQGAPTIFETDLFVPIVSAVLTTARQVNPNLPEQLSDQQRLAANIIAEHTRALTFLLADGFTPSNEGAGYVLRRVLRRAYRFGRRLGVEEPFLFELVPSVVGAMEGAYPDLERAQQRIVTWLQQEERQFAETLERAWGPLMDAIERAQTAGLTVLPGQEAFRLHDTYGLPKDLAAEIAVENGLKLDGQGFEEAMAAQRERARSHAEQDFAFGGRSGYQSFVGRTEFLGYAGCTAQATVLGIVREGTSADSLLQGEEGELFLDQTPFYAEAGGQVGDRGKLVAEGVSAEVLDTYYPVEAAYAHRVRVTKGKLQLGAAVAASVDEDRRQAIARAHTATHLLHHMLRQVLGEHAVQSGSLVDADRLRFDFAHFAALTEDERRRIEDGVLDLSLQDRELVCREMTLEEARALGAIALFGEKYGERVRVVQIGDFSKELCGGTHLPHASAIGGFAIVSEGSIGAGMRRIEAVTGKEAHMLAARQRELLAEAARALKSTPEQVAKRIVYVQAQIRAQSRVTARAQVSRAKRDYADLHARAQDVNGVKVVAARVHALGREALRALADQVRSKLGSGVVVLGSKAEGRVQLVAAVSKDLLAAGYHAGNLIREVAKLVGGGGGGRPDFAQAGGKNPERLDEALAKVKDLVAAQQL
jgi:alanyl-tRNA synthetase